MQQQYKFNPKPEFEARMQALLPDPEDYKLFSEIIHKAPENFIRCNTLKISTEKLKERLEKKWTIEQPFQNHEEIFIIKSPLLPGELGKSIEHLLGYYYVQELSSMLSILALDPKPQELFLDLCASPGSKTTQAAAKMQNSGTIIANDKDMGRISILSSNLERCGVTNVIMTRMDGRNLCERFFRNKIKFDKILVDAPCTGEGTLRSSPKTFLMWNPNMIRKLSSIQKDLLISAIPLIKRTGTLVYSTCTHSPEENEAVVSQALEMFPDLELESISLPVKCRPGVKSWKEEDFKEEVEKSCRIYPQDNNSEGFFVAKFHWKQREE